MFRFNKKYFLITIVIFTIEATIAIFIKDKFIRPYFGDFLVVILIYCFIRSFTKIKLWPAVIFVLLISFFVEFLQFYDFISLLGFKNNQFANIIAGSTFEWLDIFVYTSGIFFVVLIEKTKYFKLKTDYLIAKINLLKNKITKLAKTNKYD